MEIIKTNYRWITVHPRKKAPDVRCVGRDIYDVYRRPSYAKVYAYEKCREMMQELDGRDFCIISHNCQTFSVSFVFGNPTTGELMRAVITACNAYAYYL